MKIITWVAGLALALLLAGCATAPSHVIASAPQARALQTPVAKAAAKVTATVPAPGFCQTVDSVGRFGTDIRFRFQPEGKLLVMLRSGGQGVATFAMPDSDFRLGSETVSWHGNPQGVHFEATNLLSKSRTVVDLNPSGRDTLAGDLVQFYSLGSSSRHFDVAAVRCVGSIPAIVGIDPAGRRSHIGASIPTTKTTVILSKGFCQTNTFGLSNTQARFEFFPNQKLKLLIKKGVSGNSPVVSLKDTDFSYSGEYAWSGPGINFDTSTQGIFGEGHAQYALTSGKLDGYLLYHGSRINISGGSCVGVVPAIVGVPTLTTK